MALKAVEDPRLRARALRRFSTPNVRDAASCRSPRCEHERRTGHRHRAQGRRQAVRRCSTRRCAGSSSSPTRCSSSCTSRRSSSASCADDVLVFLARGLEVPLSRVYGVATFYNLFSLEPKGEHTCTVCLGTACYVKGSGEHPGRARRGVRRRGRRAPPPTASSRWWWPAASAPAARPGGGLRSGDASAARRPTAVLARREGLDRAMNGTSRCEEIAEREAARRACSRHGVGVWWQRPGLRLARVGRGPGRAEDRRAWRRRGWQRPGRGLPRPAAWGLCHAGPLVQVESRDGEAAASAPPGPRRDEEPAERIAAVRDHLRGGKPLPDRQLTPTRPSSPGRPAIVLAGAGELDPSDIESCIAAGAYQALQQVLTEMKPPGGHRRDHAERPARPRRRRLPDRPEVVARWPRRRAPGSSSSATPTRATRAPSWTARCWRAIRTAVLEGMAIAAYAVGADQGYVYVRGEYPLAIKRLRTAIEQAERQGLLGAPHPRHRLRLPRRRCASGAGAFVCGEETALIASIEGRRGTPRPRPPYPAQVRPVGPAHAHQQRRDLRQRPADHPERRRLVRRHRHREVEGHQGLRAGRADREHRAGRGARWASRSARSSSRSAAASRTAAAFKAAQTGGPSGGCIPAQHLDLPVDYESLQQVGSIMGSGGLIVMDETSLHGRRGRLLHGVLPRRVLRQVRPLPRRHGADARPPPTGSPRGEGSEADLARLEELAELLRSHQPVRAGPGGAQPGGLDAPLLPRGVPGPRAASGAARPASAACPP